MLTLDRNLASANFLEPGNTDDTTTQTFPITVTTALQITSPSTLSVTAGFPVNFLVTTTGSPAPSLSTALDLSFVELTFKDNGNGTATISGTPTPGGSGCTSVNGAACGITATNSQGTVTQSFIVFINPSPSPNLVSSSATFVAGIPNSVRVTSVGAITPVSYIFGTGYLAPSWLSFHDNGDGSGVLSGTPPDGTAGPYTFTLEPLAVGNQRSLASANFTLNVNDAPVFTGSTVANFTVGTAGSFEIDTNGASVSAYGFTFPQGLTFQSGTPASITGTPSPGTGGVQTVPLTATDSSGSVSQMLTINIYEAPHILSANSATFFTGMPGSFAVTTTGYPSLSTQPVSQNSAPPTDPTQGQGMYFTVTGLPSDLRYSNLNPQGLATGTLTIQGTSSAGDAGLQQVQITAQNGVGLMAQQTLALDIIAITGSAPASGSTCNGNYNGPGAFKGTLTVSAGQNCTFIGGGVTGSIVQNGGNLALTNATVSGNVQVQGSAAFSLGQGTVIEGNLAIQNVASGVSMNQICGAKLMGNVLVYGNATPFQLGSASPDSCPGNLVGGNLAVNSNTAAGGVFNNDVTKNLSCGSNTSITGGGDMARSKQGQCATF